MDPGDLASKEEDKTDREGHLVFSGLYRCTHVENSTASGVWECVSAYVYVDGCIYVCVSVHASVCICVSVCVCVCACRDWGPWEEAA